MVLIEPGIFEAAAMLSEKGRIVIPLFVFLACMLGAQSPVGLGENPSLNCTSPGELRLLPQLEI